MWTYLVGGALFNLLQKVCLRSPGSLDILVKAHQRNRTNSMYIEIHKKTSLAAQNVKCLPTWGRKESDMTERLHSHSEMPKRFLTGLRFMIMEPQEVCCLQTGEPGKPVVKGLRTRGLLG